MKRTELKPVVIYTCDVCGVDITGSWRTFGLDQPDEQHACSGRASCGGYCSDILAQRRAIAARFTRGLGLGFEDY